MPRPPCLVEYNTLDDMVASAANIPSHCKDVYLMRVESKMMNSALQSYTDIVTHGYDARFKVYANYIRELVPM